MADTHSWQTCFIHLTELILSHVIETLAPQELSEEQLLCMARGVAPVPNGARAQMNAVKAHKKAIGDAVVGGVACESKGKGKPSKGGKSSVKPAKGGKRGGAVVKGGKPAKAKGGGKLTFAKKFAKRKTSSGKGKGCGAAAKHHGVVVRLRLRQKQACCAYIQPSHVGALRVSTARGRVDGCAEAGVAPEVRVSGETSPSDVETEYMSESAEDDEQHDALVGVGVGVADSVAAAPAIAAAVAAVGGDGAAADPAIAAAVAAVIDQKDMNRYTSRAYDSTVRREKAAGTDPDTAKLRGREAYQAARIRYLSAAPNLD